MTACFDAPPQQRRKPVVPRRSSTPSLSVKSQMPRVAPAHVRDNKLLKKMLGMQRQPLLDGLTHKNHKVRMAAIETLGVTFPDDLSLLPVYRKLLQGKDAGLAYATTEALARWKKEATLSVALLSMGLRHPNWMVNVGAIRALGTHGTKAKRVLPQMLVLLQHPNLEVQMEVAKALGQVKAPASKVVRSLALKIALSPDYAKRAFTDALRAWGKDAAITRPVLELLLQNKDTEVRKSAMRTIASFGDKASPSLQKIVKVLRHDSDVLVQEVAAQALATLGDVALPVRPTMVDALGFVYFTVQVEILKALQGQKVKPSRQLFNAVTDLARSSHKTLRRQAQTMLQSWAQRIKRPTSRSVNSLPTTKLAPTTRPNSQPTTRP